MEQNTDIMTNEAIEFGEWLSRVAVPGGRVRRLSEQLARAKTLRLVMDVDDVVVASSDYTAANDDEVSLKSGDIVEVLDTKTALGAKRPKLHDLDLEATLLDTSAAKHKIAIRPKKNHPKNKSGTKINENDERWLVRVIEDVSGGEMKTRQGLVPANVLHEKQTAERDQTALAARRQAVVRELIETEEEFGRDMQQVVSRYMKPIDKTSAPKPVFDNRELLFSNFRQICEFHNTVLLEGIKYYAGEPRMLGRALLRMEREFDKHVAYCRDEPRAQYLLANDEVVSKYFQDLADSLGDDKGITEHLKLPIQRINDYQLLLKELVKYSKRLGEDCGDLQKALELFLGVPNRATDNKFLASIEGFRGNIFKLGRLLTHDWFTVADQEGKTKDRYLFLFKARILVCKVKRISEDRSVFVLKDIIKLPEVEVEEISGEPLKFKLHQKNPPLDLILGAHKQNVKNSWLAEIKKHASDAVALAEHAADDLQVLQPESKDLTEENKKKREHPDEVVESELKVEEKRSRIEEAATTEVSVKEETSQQLTTKRKASIESTVATKISKSEVVEVTSVSETQESVASVVSTKARTDITTDLETKSSVTVSSLSAETGSATSQSEEQTVKTALTETKVEEQIVQASQISSAESLKSSVETSTEANVLTSVTSESNQEAITLAQNLQSTKETNLVSTTTEVSTSDKEVQSGQCTKLEETSTKLVESVNQVSEATKDTTETVNQVSNTVKQSSETQVVDTSKVSTETDNQLTQTSENLSPKTSETEEKTETVVQSNIVEASDKSVEEKESLQENKQEESNNQITSSVEVTTQVKETEQSVNLESVKLGQETKESNALVSEQVSSSTGEVVEEKVNETGQTVTAEETGDEMSRYSRSSRISGEYSSSTRKSSAGGRYETSSYDNTGLSSYSRRESGSRVESGRYETGGAIEGGASSRYESKYSSSSRVESGSKYGIESSYESKVEGSKYGIDYDSGSKRESIASKYGIESDSKIDSIASKYGIESETTSKIDSIASKYGIDSESGTKVDGYTSKYGIESETTSKIDSIASKYRKESDGTIKVDMVSSKYGAESETSSKIDNIASKYGIESKYEAEGRSSKYSSQVSYDGNKVDGVSTKLESSFESSTNGGSAYESKYSKRAISNGVHSEESEITKSSSKSETLDGRPLFSKTLEGQNIELTPEERRERNALNAPYFLVALKDTEIMENTYLRFMIRVKGDPNPEVKFYREDKEIVTSERISIVTKRADRGCYELVIPDVTPADAGNYSCRAMNIYGDVVTEAKVTVVDDKNIFGELAPGGDGLLAKGEKPSFSWKKDGLPYDPEERFKVLLGDDEDSLALVFQHVKPEDAGLYTCVAKTSTGNISCSAELTVQGAVHELHREPEKPTLVIEHREAIVSMGASAMLELQCKGYPKPNVVFKHDGKVVEPDTRHKFLYEDEESMSLVIKNVTSADAGEYEVTATNELGEDTTTMNLVVKAPPRFKRKIENQTCMVGSTHTVTIEVEGVPSPDLTFYKDGNEIKSSERIQIVKESEEIYKIIIKDAKLTDTGSYSVVAKNEVNQCSEFWQWHVTSPPRVTKKLGGSKTVDEKETVTFSIETEAEPAATVKWYKNKTELTESSTVKISSSGSAHSLVITSAARADAGEYSCEVRNVHGEASDSCTLNVRCAPLFTQRLRDVTAAEGDVDVEFTVAVDAFPQPTVKWYLGDVEVTEKKSVFSRVDSGNTHKLILKEVYAEYSGQYTCKVSNELGDDSCQATFTVNRKPRFTKSLVDMTVDAGQTLKLDVEVEGTPEPKVRWFKDGKEVTTDARIKIERDTKRLENYHLTVTLVKEEDGGEYEVRAENEFGSVSSKSIVTVHTREVHTRITKEEVESEIDSEAKQPLEEEVEKDKKSTAKKDKTEPEKIEEKSIWDDDDTDKAKKPIVEEPETPKPEKGRKSISEPEIAEEKSFWDDAAEEEKPKKVTFEDTEKPAKKTGRKSFSEPETAEEKSIWDDDDGKNKKPIIEEVDTTSDKGKKSVTEPESVEEKSFWDDDDSKISKKPVITEVDDDVPDKGSKTSTKPEEAEEKSIWDENHNEKNKQPVIEEVVVEKKVGDKGATKPESIEEVPIDEDLKSPKRKSVKKKSVSEEPMSAGIEASPTLKDSTFKDKEVFESLPLVYTVEASGTPKPTVKWLHNGKEVKPCGRVHISNEGDLYKIEIDRVNLDDAGQWQCEISNDLGKNVLKADLTVKPESELRKPKFTQPLKAQRVLQREPVTLQAVCTADPQPHVSWLLNGVELTPDATIVTSADTKEIDNGLKECTFKLQIPTGRHSDTGTYTIQAKNKYGVGESSARLDILLRPEIEGLKDVTAVPYEETTFVANVRANPIAEIQWSKDGYVIKPSSKIEISSDQDAERYSLTVKKVGVDDAGVYTLTAKNEVGETAQQAKLVIRTGEPIFTKPLQKQTVKDYDDCTLKVRCDGEPKPEVKWFVNGKEISNDDRHTVTTTVGGQVDSELEVKHFNNDDAGKYKVKALNLAGEASCEAQISLAQSAPGFTHRLERQKDVDEGEPLELKAKVDGSPAPTATWYKDGVPIPADDEHVKQSSLAEGWVKLNIEKVTPSDCGAYKLVISNPNGDNSALCAVAVNPTPRKPSFSQELEDTKAVVGQPLKLEARVMAFPAPEIKWFKDGLPVRPSQAINFINQPGGVIGLSIDNCKPEDAGVYSLTVTNKLGEVGSKAKAEVTQKERKPAFIAELQPTKVIEGFPVRLEVKVLGHPPPTIKWTLDGKEIIPDGVNIRTISQPDGTHALLLAAAKPSDAGRYGVIASNDKGETKSEADLTVASRQDDSNPQERPQFIHGLRDITAEEGQPLSVSAPFVGNPVPEVTWTKDGQPLTPNEKILLTCDGKRVGIEINPLELPDAGVYSVKLVNPLGEDSTQGNITVKKVYQAPTFSQRFTDLQQLPTFDAKFPARVFGIPFPEITWYKDGVPLKHSDKYNIKRDGDAACLYVRDIGLTDAGVYKCVAKNREGEAECQASLEVVDKIARKQKVEPPSFLKKIGDIEVLSGMSAKFTACATGSPEPDVEWYRNEEKLFPSERIRMDKESTGLLRLTIGRVDPSDVATYRCRLVNPHGEASCTAQLTYDSMEPLASKRPIGDQYSDFDKMKKTGIPMPLADRPIISRMTDRHLTLSWKPSIPHGPRFPVTYQVEMCEVPDGDWFTARTGLRSCVCDIRNLEPFRDYKFRIRVENKYGVSDPSPFALTHRAKLEPDPPKFVPYLEPGIDFRPETSPYFPKDFDIERPPHDGYAQAPRFLRQEHDSQYGVKGHNVNLFWFVYGYPKPKMTYYYNDEPIDIGGRYDWSYTRNGQATLFINKMLERDAGWYEAVATNEHGQARQRVRLELAEYPTFIRRPEETVVLQRKTVRIEARVTGVPYPEIKWYKDWQPLAPSARIKIQFIEPDTTVLVISDAILKDEGLYSVSARNVAGAVSSSAMLHVEEDDYEYTDRIREHPPRVKPSTKPFGDFYDIGDELGRGVQGVVYHAAERQTGRNYAAKIMHGHSDLKPFMKNEIDIMNLLNDRHLVRLHGAHEHEHTVALVTELAGGGELLRDGLLRSTSYPERRVAAIIRQVLLGLRHMHDNSVAHLGLTIGELLLSHAGSDDIKICDFGLSRRIRHNELGALHYGMPEYVAPEVVNGDGVSFPADMWSLGIITYILLSGHSPFRGQNDRETLTKIKEGSWKWHDEEWWSRLSTESRDFISKLLVYKWSDRMDVRTALSHPWLTLADRIYQEEYQISTDRLRNYYNLYRDWTSNAQCRTWFRRRPLSGAFEHPSKMVYPPGHIYTPEGTPDRDLGPRDRVPGQFDVNFKQWDHPDWEVNATSESHYQNGPDTYLLQLRDTQFPVRLREYMKVACHRSPAYSINAFDNYDPRTPIIRERRRFTDIMDEEIDDERRDRINGYGSESGTVRRLRHELGTRLDSYAEAQAFMETKRDGCLPFFREKPQLLPVREGEPAKLTCLAVGDPKPVIQWFKNDMVIAEGQRIKIVEDEEGRSSLEFSSSMHHDIGFYKVVARNKNGQTVARTRIVEATTPDAPDVPAAAEVSDTEVLLRWKQPKYDGNSPVLCYSLQYKAGDSVEWKEVANNIDHEFFVVRDLTPDTSYQFRLSSRNRIGWSEKGAPTNLVKTKDSGAPKIEITKAMKHLQQLTESGQEIVLDEEKPQLDYTTENQPVEWYTANTFTERYSFISELWRGKFSIVVKGIDKTNDTVVVAKILENRPETEVQVEREYECLRRLRHERIANLLGAYRAPGSPVSVLILERLQGADVLTFLASRHQYSEQLVATVITQALDGLQYLHWRGYCHLDLQPDNFVMASVRSVQVKLVDFGSAHKVTKLGTSVPQVGSLEYKAPEIINDEPAYPQTDIWSIGVLAYILLSGVSPYRGNDDNETKQNISFVRYRFEHLYKEITQEATRFLMFVFKKVPLKRPTAEECHEHRWLAQSDFISKKRERAVFDTTKLKEFSDEYHERKAQEASQADTLSAAFGSLAPRLLTRSNSIQEELLTNISTQ